MSGAPLSRRRLLQLAAGAAAAWSVRPWPLRLPTAGADDPVSDAVLVPTLEAFADTLIPGAKRSPADRAIAGAAAGPGAVQAGAVDLLRFPPAGVSPVLPALVVGLNEEALRFDPAAAASSPGDPPLVALPFERRTALLLALLTGDSPARQAWEALAALVFLAFHTAGHLPTAQAVRNRHPGLAWIGFPAPDADGLWRFPHASYRRRLARTHPATVGKGSPP